MITLEDTFNEIFGVRQHSNTMKLELKKSALPALKKLDPESILKVRQNHGHGIVTRPMRCIDVITCVENGEDFESVRK